MNSIKASVDERPDLACRGTVEELVRTFARVVLTSRGSVVDGEISADEAGAKVYNFAQWLARIFNGKDDSFLAPAWNSPDQLGTYLKARFDTTCSTSEVTLVHFIKLSDWLNHVMDSSVQDQLSVGQTARLLEWVVEFDIRALLGIDEKPAIEELRPLRHPFMKVGPTGTYYVFTAGDNSAFESRLRETIARDLLSWDDEWLCWQVKPQNLTEWELSFLLHMCFPTDPNDVGPPWPMALPYGADTRPCLASDELKAALDHWVEHKHWRPVLGEGDFRWYWMLVLWANCIEQQADLPAWLLGVLKGLPDTPTYRRRVPSYPLVRSLNRTELLIPWEVEGFNAALDLMIRSEDRTWSDSAQCWSISREHRWTAYYLAERFYPASEFGNGECAPAGVDDDSPSAEDWSDFIADLGSPKARADLLEASCDDYGSPGFFWQTIAHHRQNARRLGVKIPAWMDKLLAIAPDRADFLPPAELASEDVRRALWEIPREFGIPLRGVAHEMVVSEPMLRKRIRGKFPLLDVSSYASALEAVDDSLRKQFDDRAAAVLMNCPVIGSDLAELRNLARFGVPAICGRFMCSPAELREREESDDLWEQEEVEGYIAALTACLRERRESLREVANWLRRQAGVR